MQSNVPINPQRLIGTFHTGVALDVHTIRSSYLGPDKTGRDHFDTVRSELGELLYRFKYQGDPSAAPVIIATAARYLMQHRSKIDVIVPVPSSKQRQVQPVLVLAEGLGKALAVPVSCCVTKTRASAEIKGIDDPAQRKALLSDLYTIDPRVSEHKNVLIFDDLFRSGSTMNAMTDILLGQGKAAIVRAFTITRSRSKI